MMKLLVVAFLSLASFSVLAQENALRCLNKYKSLSNTEGYALDYLNSQEADWINTPIDNAFDTFPPAGVIMVVPVLLGATIIDATTMPIAISKRVKGKRGQLYFKAISSQTSGKEQRAYKHLLEKARETSSELSEKQLNDIIMNGYSNEFCKNKKPVSKRKQLEYILNEVEKNH